jgi:transposase
MEATGVYWIPIYEILDARGFEVLLVNARHFRNVPGRKSDVSDCEWIRELHSVGLLRGSFRPTDAIVALRAYMRHRQTLVESTGTYTQRMQKALVQMNLQLPLVVTDITGVTGLRILRDIVAGQRDPQHLAAQRDFRVRASTADIVAALTGHDRPEHLFVLQQNLELFDACQAQLAACDRAIDAHVQTLTAQRPSPVTPVPDPRVTKKPHDNQPRFEIRAPLFQLTGGVDLTQIDGVAPYTALTLIAEIGRDMTRWPTEKHFTSWLALSPGNKISGGKLLSSRTKASANRVAAALRMAASTLHHTRSALGAFFRRLKARLGAPKAITATARKLACLVYSMLTHGTAYVDQGQHYYEQRYQQRALSNLSRRAQELGYTLVKASAAGPLPA